MTVDDGIYFLGLVDRLELIDEHGRAYIIRTGAEVTLSFQDGGKTLKVFAKGKL